MDWFKSSLQAAHKQAQEAADKARTLAQQASVQARAIAEQASEQAKVFAGQASEQAKVFAEQATEKAKQASEKAKVMATAAAEEAQAKLQQLTAQTTSSSSANAPEVDPAELAQYGVTPGLLETVSGMTYSTFSDYPMELLPTTNPMGLTPPIPPPGFRLSSWQERHALLVLTRGDQLQGLRFALCPKRMSEEMFWVIYYTLVKTLLPPEAFAKAPQGEAAAREAAGGADGVAVKGLGTAPSSVKSLQAAAAMPISTHSSTSRLADELPSTTAASAAAPAASGAVAAAPTASASAVGGEAVLVDVGSSNTGEEDDDVEDDDEEEEEDDDGAEGGEADLDALEDDPELAAYLEEALDVAEGGEAEGLSDLGSATDDLDDYINQLDAELGAEDASGDGEASPAKPVHGAA